MNTPTATASITVTIGNATHGLTQAEALELLRQLKSALGVVDAPLPFNPWAPYGPIPTAPIPLPWQPITTPWGEHKWPPGTIIC